MWRVGRRQCREAQGAITKGVATRWSARQLSSPLLGELPTVGDAGIMRPTVEPSRHPA